MYVRDNSEAHPISRYRFAAFLGVYLLSIWLDERKSSPGLEAIVCEGAVKVLMLVPVLVAILLSVVIPKRLGIIISSI